MNLQVFVQLIRDGLWTFKMLFLSTRIDHYGYLHPTSKVLPPKWGGVNNVYIYEGCWLNGCETFIGRTGKFILKKNCSVAKGLTVITDNHRYNKAEQVPGKEGWGECTGEDVIVNEHVWIGANVTLCPGTVIGRGSIVAAGSVCVRSHEYPPYSIIGGNPAHFIKFRLSLEDQIKHENLYFADNKIDAELLRNNYYRYKKVK